MAAAYHCHDAVVQLLLDKGANIEAEDNVSPTRSFTETIILESTEYILYSYLVFSFYYLYDLSVWCG